MSLLAVEDLVVRYGALTALRGASIRVEEGEVFFVTGPNGAGKSTLLDCLSALRKPDAGRVTLDGRALRDLPARTRSRRIAYLPQNAEIAWAVEGRTFVGLGRTPYVGAWGLRADDRAAVARAMAVAGVDAFADRVALHIELNAARQILDGDETRLAHDPLEHDPSGNAHLHWRGFERFGVFFAIQLIELARGVFAREVVGVGATGRSPLCEFFATLGDEVVFVEGRSVGLIGHGLVEWRKDRNCGMQLTRPATRARRARRPPRPIGRSGGLPGAWPRRRDHPEAPAFDGECCVSTTPPNETSSVCT